MKLATDQIIPPDDPPCNPPSGLFFRTVCKAASITRKELAYDLRVSKTLVDGWIDGTKNDPFTQARRAVQLFKKRKDLLAAILIYIAGSDEFDEAVLERIQQLLTKVVAT